MTRLFVLFAASLFSISAFADVKISDAYARATFKLATTGAAYLSLSNSGKKADTLVKVDVDKSVAASAEIHTVVMENDMMQMRELKQGLSIPAGETVELTPGGFHIMLIGLNGPLEEGNTVDLTLVFSSGQSSRVSANIIKL